jgi:adenylate cyclase
VEFVNDIENRVRDYLGGDYEVTETQTIPSVDSVPFGKKVKKMKLCAYCIDLRKSSELLVIHQKQTSGKIHKAFLAAASKVVLENDGEIRSFNGDSLLAFWPAHYKWQLSAAIRAAMITK